MFMDMADPVMRLREMMKLTVAAWVHGVRVAGAGIDLEWFLAGPGRAVRERFYG